MISIPSYLDSKYPLLFTKTELGYLHISWEVEGGKILVVEDIYDNYPAIAIAAFDSLEDYLDSISGANWITDSDYVVKYDNTKSVLTKLIHPGIKMMEDWKGSSFYEFLSPGDMVEDEFAEYFINIMPPETYSSHLIQVGEPFDHIDGRPVYATLEKVNSHWFYRGNCFTRETENQTEHGSYKHFYEINFYGEGHEEDWSFYLKSITDLSDEEVKATLKNRYIYVDGLKQHHIDNIVSIDRITAEEFREYSGIEF